MFERVRSRRWVAIAAISIAVFAVIWMISPWLYLSGLRIEAVRVEQPADRAMDRPAGVDTEQVIIISFTTAQDLSAFRERWGLPFIQAKLAACADRSVGSNDEVITQAAGYFADRRRVRAMGRVSGPETRYAYEVVFTDRLSSIGGDHKSKQTTASTVPGGLCFRLHGATIASGSVRSADIPVAIPES